MSNNFASSTLVNAPGMSGTTFAVQAGHGPRFVAGKAVVYPQGTAPADLWTSAEVVTLGAPSGDSMTVTRAQESSSAKDIGVGWVLAQGVTAGMWDGLTGTYAPRTLAKARRLSPRSRTIHPSPPTITDVNPHGIASPVEVFATVAEHRYFRKLAGGSFSDIGSQRITAGQTEPGVAIRDPFSVEVQYYGQTMAFRTVSAPGNTWRVWVDDQPVTSWTPTAGAGGGATRYIKVAFGAVGNYKIRLDQTGADIVSLVIGPNDSIGTTQPRGPRCICVTDSYGGGSGTPPTGYNGITSWIQTFAEYMGWDDVWNSGIGGTGWVTRNASKTNNFEDRIPGIIAQAPDVVIFQGGKNDPGAAQAGAAAGRAVAALRAGLPNCVIVVTGPVFDGGNTAFTRDATWGPVEDAIFSAVSGNALTVSTASSSIFTGTGTVAAPSGTGNGDVFIQSGGVHPNQAGADYLGRRLAHGIAAVLL